MKSQTQKARELLNAGKFKECLKIMKTFKLGLTKDQKAHIARAYEMMTGRESFYTSMGFSLQTETTLARQAVETYLMKGV